MKNTPNDAITLHDLIEIETMTRMLLEKSQSLRKKLALHPGRKRPGKLGLSEEQILQLRMSRRKGFIQS